MIRTMTALLMSALLALGLSACSSDDDPADPGGGGGGAAPTDPLQQAGLQAMGFSLALAEVLPQWWDGDLVDLAKADPLWDGENMRWIVPLEYWDPAYTLPNSAGVTATARVQYLAGEVPQQSAAGATLMDIELELGVSHSVYQDEDNNSALTGDFVANIQVVETAPDVFEFGGSAFGNVHVSRTTGGQSDDEYVNEVGIDWLLGVPAGGCPTGSIAVTQATRIFSLGFEGSQTVYWSWAPGDQTFVNGELEIACGS